MLNTASFLLLYYFGYGFVLALGWLCIPDPSSRAQDPEGRNHLHQLARGLAVVGVIHPVLALAGRDVAVRLSRSDGPFDPRAPQTVRVTRWGLWVALGVTLLVVASQLGPFDGVPVLRQIRAGLPFAEQGHQ